MLIIKAMTSFSFFFFMKSNLNSSARPENVAEIGGRTCASFTPAVPHVKNGLAEIGHHPPAVFAQRHLTQLGRETTNAVRSPLNVSVSFISYYWVEREIKKALKSAIIRMAPWFRIPSLYYIYLVHPITIDKWIITLRLSLSIITTNVWCNHGK